MNVIQLLPIGELDRRVLRELAAGLAAEFSAGCEVLERELDPAPAYHVQRQQYLSTELLARMSTHLNSWRLLGVTDVDLYIPILTFVFGEAQMNGSCAVVSTHRLRQEFYGLPTNGDLVQQRLLKEAAHEVGHTLGLTHCEDYRCAMAPSYAVEWIDVKGSKLCEACKVRACGVCRENGLAVRPGGI